MRELIDHKVNPANDVISITVTDEPGAGGANHRYEITGYNAESNPSLNGEFGDDIRGTVILFQNGPIGDSGVNGITQEVLLAILADRLRSFQSGPYSSRDNAIALTKIEEAMLWLHKRTIDRMRRGVEGTHKI